MTKERYIELFKTPISDIGLDNLKDIVDYCHKKGTTDIRSVAYMLATIYHETAHTFLPIAEYGKGKGLPYGKPRPNGKIYYGRGYVQITWEENYVKFARLLKVDLFNNPDLALEHNIAKQIAWLGMTKGIFTGKKLADYFNIEKTDYIGARRVINGTDKAQLIAGYAVKFHNFLTN